MKKQRRKLILIGFLSVLLIFTSIIAFSTLQKVHEVMDIKKEEKLLSNKQSAHDPSANLKHNISLMKVEVPLKKRKVANPSSKIIALTFDDGPGYGSTQRILNTLAKYNVKATWFCLGSRAQKNPDMLQKISNAGHEINNHSYSHANFFNLSLDSVRQEVQSTSDIIGSITGKRPLYLRPPYGNYNSAIAQTAGLPIALWNVDSLDWKLKNGFATAAHVEETLKDNSIILMHDIYETTADAIDLLIPKLINQGYQFVTYTELKSYGG